MVKSDVSGNFGKMITYSLLETDAFGAEVFTIATKGKNQFSEATAKAKELKGRRRQVVGLLASS